MTASVFLVIVLKMLQPDNDWTLGAVADGMQGPCCADKSIPLLGGWAALLLLLFVPGETAGLVDAIALLIVADVDVGGRGCDCCGELNGCRGIMPMDCGVYAIRLLRA